MSEKSHSPSSKVRTVTIDARDAGQRIDNFLISQLKGVPRSRIYTLLRKGQVRVNSGRVKPLRKLKLGDSVRIPPVRLDEREASEIPPGALACLREACLWEDEHWVAIDKPAGMAVHAGSGVGYGVIEAMREAKPEWARLDLVHRLDRDTSGVLLLAKSGAAVRAGHGLFAERGAKKSYLALLAGRLPEAERWVEAPLGQYQQGGERMVRVDPAGKSARSHFRRLKDFERATLAAVDIETGRMHQIRVHAQHLGCPVVGDDKYGHRDINKAFRAEGLKGMCLHAARLRFHFQGQDYDFQAPAPEAWGLYRGEGLS